MFLRVNDHMKLDYKKIIIGLCLFIISLGFAWVGDFDTSVYAQSSSFSFAAGGDIGVGKRSEATLRAIPGSGAAFYIALGDLSYGNLYPESLWCDYVKGYAGATFPFELIAGNHEDGDVTAEGFIDNFAACLPHRLGAITGTYGREYYFDYQNLARFIMISPAIDYTTGRWVYSLGNAHYNFVASAIDGARQAGIHWVIVGMHKNCITTGVKNCEIGADLFNLLVSKKVDLILQGHDHNYQRSKQLSLNPANCTAIAVNGYRAGCVVDDGADGNYTKGAGSVLVINGNAGKCCYNVVASDPEVGYFQKIVGSSSIDTNGFVKYTVSATSITAQVINTTGNYSDSFRIEDSANPSVSASPTLPSCPALPTNTGETTLNVTIPQNGTYRIWSRIQAPDSTNNSYYVQVDNTCAKLVGDTAIPANSWQWVDWTDGSTQNIFSMDLVQGVHQVKLIGAEPNVKVDRVIFTSDVACTPVLKGDNCVSPPTPTQNVPTHTPTPTPDVAPPSVTIQSPADGSTVNGMVDITVQATDAGGVDSVDVFIDTVKKVTLTSSPYIYVWDTSTDTNGSHTLQAQATDKSANGATSSAITVRVDNPSTTKPTVSIISPSDGQTVAGTITVSVQATDDIGVDRTELYIDGVLLSGDDTAPYEFIWDTTTKPNGIHSLQARAYDGAGNMGSSPSVSVNVQNALSATTLSFAPVDDASIYKTRENTNFGNNKSLEVDKVPYKNFLLKFSVSALGKRQVKSAILRLYNINFSKSGGQFYGATTNAWDQSSVTWSNAPAISGNKIAELQAVSKGKWYDVDLSSYITGDGTYSLRIDTKSPNGADYASTEYGRGYAPRLIITTQ